MRGATLVEIVEHFANAGIFRERVVEFLLIEAEQLGALRRTRPDITLSVFRFANLVGPETDTPLAQLLARRVIPKPK